MSSTWENIKTVWLYLQLIVLFGGLAAFLWWLVPKVLNLFFVELPQDFEEAKYKYNDYQDCYDSLRRQGYGRNDSEAYCKEITGWMSE